MRVSWNAPDFDGGTDITGYRLEYKNVASREWILVNTSDSSNATQVVQGLEENTEYSFRVYAETGVGISDASVPSDLHRTLGTSFDIITCV